MADYRQIHTQIWKDEWFMDLSIEDKLLFVYLFSNESSNLAGIYKLPLRVACFETGLPLETVKASLARFEQDQRVLYRDGVVWVIHMRRYHATGSELVEKNIRKSLDQIPDSLIKSAYEYYQNTGKYSIDTVCIGYVYPALVEESRVENSREEKSKGELPPPSEPLFEDDELSTAFEKASGILAHNPPKWTKAIKAIRAKGATAEDVTKTVQELRGKTYTILGPWSIENAIINTIAKRKTSGSCSAPQYARVTE